jgi:hypothetical protein
MPVPREPIEVQLRRAASASHDCRVGRARTRSPAHADPPRFGYDSVFTNLRYGAAMPELQRPDAPATLTLHRTTRPRKE